MTSEVWNILLDAYRKFPGNHNAAAQAAGVGRKTAKRCWDTGYEKSEWGKRPISELVKIEMGRARADMSSAERGAHREAIRTAFEDSIVDLVESRAMWGRIVRRATGNTAASAQLSAILLRGVLPVADKVRQDMEAGDVYDTPEKRERVLRLVVSINKMVVDSHMVARELEDNVLGELDDLTGMTTNMTEEEAMEEIAEAMAAMERSARKGRIDPELWEGKKRDAWLTVPPEDVVDVEATEADDAERLAIQEKKDAG